MHLIYESDTEMEAKMSKLDKNAFAEKVLEIKDEAYRIAYCYLKDENESMDAYCNAIEKAFVNLKNLRNYNLFKTWFIRIVINECKMTMRKNNRVIAINDDLLDVYNSEDRVSNITLEEKMDLDSVLEKLKSNERILIYLKYYMGYTLRDIASLLEIPEGTVKSKIYNIIKVFKEKLGRH